MNILDTFTQHVWAPPITKVLRYSSLKRQCVRNGIMLDFYPELPHIQKVPCKVTQWWRLYLQKLVKTVVFVCGRLPYKEVIDAPTHQHNTKTRSSPFSKIPKEKMATSTAPWGILCPRQYWYDFISFFPAGLNFRDCMIQVVEYNKNRAGLPLTI